MSRSVSTARSLVILAAVVALAASACAPDDTDNAGASTATEGISGSVTISGSSTVEPISAANAQKFSELNPDVGISVDGPGTGDGFELFCRGETDISDASRPIDADEEIPACEENGVEFIELKVAVDGISVLTSAENDAVECLSFPDLYALLGPESEGFDTWAEANPLGKDVGGSGDYPDADLTITAPGEESGTYDSFAEIVLEGIAVDERGQSEDGPFVRPDYQSSGDDNVIIEGIAGNETSLGWVGYAFYAENTDSVRAIPIEEEEGGGCVEPTDETISSGEYPIARDLYIYVNKAKAEQSEALSAYVDFYLSEDGLASVSEAGYVDLDEESLAETQEAWDTLRVGTVEG